MGVRQLGRPLPQRDRRAHVRSPAAQGLDVHPERFRVLRVVLRHGGYIREGEQGGSAQRARCEGGALLGRKVGGGARVRHGHGPGGPLCIRSQCCRTDPRRPGRTHLHLRNDRPSQGRRDDALESGVERHVGTGHVRRRSRLHPPVRPLVGVPAVGPLLRPDVRTVLHHGARRKHGRRERSAQDLGGPAVGQADGIVRGTDAVQESVRRRSERHGGIESVEEEADEEGSGIGTAQVRSDQRHGRTPGPARNGPVQGVGRHRPEQDPGPVRRTDETRVRGRSGMSPRSHRVHGRRGHTDLRGVRIDGDESDHHA
mmetsp:Transcript_41440/g.76535  ORF Transcript_41440/g.76535 Transcript_41440/m.76535 type:complete len:313 (-) Transcript_41440:992-1930(-)